MNELYNNYLNTINEKIWKVAIYVRLSREDEKEEKEEKGKEQSESIENQINFLKKIVKSNGWNLIDIYRDDGYTGTNFNRPGFQRMINDIEIGKINLVITKDLSRLGRDYIGTGNYVERYFPSKNIRYIAVNDNIDTFDKNNSNNDMTPFKSVINDMYAKDISNKVRTAIVTKAVEGQCIKSFLPYGYKKDEQDKHKILIDENVSDIVKLIFDFYKSGKGKQKICDYLNENEIKTPLQYKVENTNYHNPNNNCIYNWSITMVTKILKDRIYTGDLVQLKYQKVNYKVKKTLKVPEEEQIVIKNNHPAIVDINTFETVQKMLEKQANEWNFTGHKQHLLAGLVYCSCGAKITYNLNHGKYSRCVCSSYKRNGSKFCTNVHLREEELLKRVAEALKTKIKKYLNLDKLKYDNLNKNIEKNNAKDITSLKRKQKDIDKIISKLYEDRVSGIVSVDTFSNLIKKYEKQKREYAEKIKMIEKEKHNSQEYIGKSELKEIMRKVLEFNEINEENRSIVIKLIDHITIEDRDIHIDYTFKVPDEQ